MTCAAFFAEERATTSVTRGENAGPSTPRGAQRRAGSFKRRCARTRQGAEWILAIHSSWVSLPSLSLSILSNMASWNFMNSSFVT